MPTRNSYTFRENKLCQVCGLEFFPINGKMIYCIDCKVKVKEKRYEYYGKSWLKLRFQILERDKFTCQYCGRKAPEVVLQVDHIDPFSKGGENDTENLITACYECNMGKYDVVLEHRKSILNA